MTDELRVNQLVTLQHVHHKVQVPSRKRLFQAIAEDLANPEREDREEAVDEIYDALVERERLGSTALGEGVAIPHCRTDCQAISGAFFTLDEGIDYEAPDTQPVDLVFVLMVPMNEQKAHIAALQRLAQIFSNADNLRRLRASQSDEALFQELLIVDDEICQVEPDRKLA